MLGENWREWPEFDTKFCRGHGKAKEKKKFNDCCHYDSMIVVIMKLSHLHHGSKQHQICT